MAYSENNLYRYSSTNGVSYTRLQKIFDEMFNTGRVCDEESMVQFIRDTNALPELSCEQIEESVHTFIDDTYNG